MKNDKKDVLMKKGCANVLMKKNVLMGCCLIMEHFVSSNNMHI